MLFSKWEFSRIHKQAWSKCQGQERERKRPLRLNEAQKQPQNTHSRTTFLCASWARCYLHSFRRVAFLDFPVISQSKWESELFGWQPNPVETDTAFLNWSPYAYLSVYPAVLRCYRTSDLNEDLARPLSGQMFHLPKDLSALSQAVL